MTIDKSHFNVIDIDAILKEERKDPEFDIEYRKVDALYTMINTFVKMRKEMGVTQEELAKRCFISQQAVSRIEKEKHIPNMDTFIKMLTALDITIRLEAKSSR